MKTKLLYLAPIVIAAIAAATAVLPVSAGVTFEQTAQLDPGGCQVAH